MEAETIAVTGSSGFIGKAFVEHFLARGKKVIAMQRREPELKHPGLRWRPYRLGEEIGDNVSESISAVIHCAVQFYGRKSTNADDINTESVCILLSWCRKREARFVFISSQSAHEGALSHYGRNKLRNERLCDLSRDLVLRLGLVLGCGGLFGRVAETVKRARFIPLPDGGKQPVQTIHIEDLCRAVYRCLEDGRTGRYYLAHPEVLTVRTLYESVAKKYGREPRFVSLPMSVLLPAVRVAERFGFHLPAGSENLLGLKAARPADTLADLDLLGISLRDFRQSIREL